MEKVIVLFFIHFSYYAIGALATTNIMRLLKGATSRQNDIHCVCGNCNHIIPVYRQIPVVSYLISHGECRYCGSKIPIMNTMLEITVFIIMSVITAIFKYSPLGVLMSFLAYELIRVFMLVKYGHRTDRFVREYLIAVMYVVINLGLVEFMSLLYAIV